MSAVEARPLILTADRVELLNRARDVLVEIEREAETVAWRCSLDPLSIGPNPQGCGRLAEGASVAADALFSVLNVAHAHLREPLTDVQLHNLKDDEQ